MFGREDIKLMFGEGMAWLGKHQIADKDSKHYGSIYFPTENRYCNRDTGCTTALFMRQHHITGDRKWKKKASLARDYLLDVQLENGGYQELRGLENSDNGSAVNTSIIADNLIKAFSFGLKYSLRDLEALKKMADFELTLEWKPGAFYHDTNHLGAFDDNRGCQWGNEGSQRDCQNSTALSAMMLQRIYYFLQKEGYPVKKEWLQAAARGIKHLLESQMENGHWAYCVNADWYDVGHQGMTMFHLEQAGEFPPYNTDNRIKTALIKGGKWLTKEGILHTEKGNKINWAMERSACIYFTWGYFVVSAPLCRLAHINRSNRRFWQKEATELLRYVRTDLWDNPFKEKEGPFRVTEGGVVKGYSFFGQSLGWCLYQLDDLIEHMRWF
ncbi:MAG: hypothetical protein ABIH24_05615 [Verrucomicrobiota bacterium]